MKEAIEALKKEKEVWLSKAKSHEALYQDALQNADVIAKAIRLIELRGNVPEEIIPSVSSDKYKDMSLSDAILETLGETPNLSGNEIYDKIIANGFSSGSHNIKRDVFTRLFRLETKQHKVISTNSRGGKKKGGKKKYRLPEREKEVVST